MPHRDHQLAARLAVDAAADDELSAIIGSHAGVDKDLDEARDLAPPLLRQILFCWLLMSPPSANTASQSPSLSTSPKSTFSVALALVGVRGGGADYGVYGNAHAAVDTKQWAFLEENGNQIVVQDLVKGKVLRRIDTSVLFREAGGGAQMGNPGESALLRLGPGKLAVIGGAPATGHVAVVDVESGEVKVLKAPVCGS